MIVLLFIIVSLLAMSSFIFMICFYKAVKVTREIDMLDMVRKETAKRIVHSIEHRLHDKGSGIDCRDVISLIDSIKDEYGINGL